MIQVDIQYHIAGVRFSEARLKTIIKSVFATLRMKSAHVQIVCVSDAESKIFNKQYRGINKPTDVLSFPATVNHTPEGDDHYVGDIILAFPYVTNQARTKKVRVIDEVGMLLVHGILHLVGYDHETDRDERTMFTLQNTIAKKLHLPLVDPTNV